MRSTSFYNGGFYHVYNRGVDKRSIFLIDKDRIRFLSCVDKFRIRKSSYEDSEKLVEVIAFCLMPNHYHFFLRQLADNGVSTFMQKLGTGYTMYFNNRYERSGSLFESRYKSKEIQNEAQFLHLSRYIHLNPVDLLEEDQKNIEQILSFLKRFQWSSFRHYIGVEKFNFLNAECTLDSFKTPADYQKFLIEWLSHRLDDNSQG